MTTIVEGQRRRSLNYSSFADITDAPLVSIGRGFLEFDGDLSDEDQASIRARMESTDDEDQVARAALRADRDALPADSPLRHLIDYMLDRA